MVDFVEEDEKHEIEDDQLNDVDYYCPSPHSGAFYNFPRYLIKLFFIEFIEYRINFWSS